MNAGSAQLACSSEDKSMPVWWLTACRAAMLCCKAGTRSSGSSMANSRLAAQQCHSARPTPASPQCGPTAKVYALYGGGTPAEHMHVPKLSAMSEQCGLLVASTGQEEAGIEIPPRLLTGSRSSWLRPATTPRIQESTAFQSSLFKSVRGWNRCPPRASSLCQRCSWSQDVRDLLQLSHLSQLLWCLVHRHHRGPAS